MADEIITDAYLHSLANNAPPLTCYLACCAIEAREEARKLRQRIAVLERVREAADKLDPADGDEELRAALDAAKEAKDK